MRAGAFGRHRQLQRRQQRRQSDAVGDAGEQQRDREEDALKRISRMNALRSAIGGVQRQFRRRISSTARTRTRSGGTAEVTEMDRPASIPAFVTTCWPM